MLEGKALVVAIMMLTAAPIAATDSGQIFIADVRLQGQNLFLPQKIQNVMKFLMMP